MKHILEFINYYKYGVSLASVKHKIFARIQDPSLLEQNATFKKRFSGYNDEIFRELHNVLAVEEFETHLDKLITQINIKQVKMVHSSHDIYANSFDDDDFPEWPGSFAADLSVSISDFLVNLRKIGPTEELVLKCGTLCLGQQNRMSDQQREQYNLPKLMPKDSRPLAKATNLCF